MQMHMTQKEKFVVRYIVMRLDSVYRNSYGKAEYARNMDQVIKDIFGVKKFTKSLAAAMRNETLMVNLMRRMDTKTLWNITRSKEHFQVLCSLVALDTKIVKTQKMLEERYDMEDDRYYRSQHKNGAQKIRALEKRLKKEKTVYIDTVKAFRKVFDVKRGFDGDGIVSTLNEWLDSTVGDGDIFDMDYGFGFDDYG